MSFENLSNTVSDLLKFPDFEVRAIYLVIIILFFSLSVVIHFLPETKLVFKIVLASISFLVLVAINVLPFILTVPLIEKFTFQNTFGLQIPIYILFVWQILALILRKKLAVLKPLKIIFLSLFFLSCLLIILASLFSRPYVILNNVMKGEIVNETEKIEVRLTVPVKKESLNIFISPSQDLMINYDYVWISKEWVDGFEIRAFKYLSRGNCP